MNRRVAYTPEPDTPELGTYDADKPGMFEASPSGDTLVGISASHIKSHHSMPKGTTYDPHKEFKMTYDHLKVELLPQMLQDLVAMITLPATMKIVEARGGTALYVPVRHLRDEHYLVKLIGREAAEILQHEYHGEELSIPTALKALRAIRNNEIRAKRRYMSQSMLAREYRMSGRNIRIICNEDGR
ncbi:MAG: Mor transcription activator family protein [Gallionella sp.]